MAKLLLKFETAFIKEIPLDKPVFAVGRKPDNDIVLEHPTVSGHHCKIYQAAGSYFVEDLNSTNGTFVNGKKIVKAGLKHNDSIGIIKYSLVFVGDEKASSASSQKQPETATASPKISTPSVNEADKKVPKAFLEVLDGRIDKQEYEINLVSVYIGKSSQANIPIKGSGLFGSAPDMAAVISMRPNGFFLTPIKEGYVKYNGNPLTEKVELKNDDIIEAGGTKFRFFIKLIN